MNVAKVSLEHEWALRVASSIYPKGNDFLRILVARRPLPDPHRPFESRAQWEEDVATMMTALRHRLREAPCLHLSEGYLARDAFADDSPVRELEDVFCPRTAPEDFDVVIAIGDRVISVVRNARGPVGFFEKARGAFGHALPRTRFGYEAAAFTPLDACSFAPGGHVHERKFPRACQCAEPRFDRLARGALVFEEFCCGCQQPSKETLAKIERALPSIAHTPPEGYRFEKYQLRKGWAWRITPPKGRPFLHSHRGTAPKGHHHACAHADFLGHAEHEVEYPGGILATTFEVEQTLLAALEERSTLRRRCTVHHVVRTVERTRLDDSLEEIPGHLEMCVLGLGEPQKKSIRTTSFLAMHEDIQAWADSLESKVRRSEELVPCSQCTRAGLVCRSCGGRRYLPRREEEEVREKRTKEEALVPKMALPPKPASRPTQAWGANPCGELPLSVHEGVAQAKEALQACDTSFRKMAKSISFSGFESVLGAAEINSAAAAQVEAALSKPREDLRRKRVRMLEQQAEDIFVALKAFRKKRAEEMGVPFYVVASDKALLDIARRRPRDLAQVRPYLLLRQFERHGAAMLEVIAQVMNG